MRRGFTLVELMIVIVIIAIIAAIAIPNLMRAKKKANRSAAQSVLKSFSSAAAMFAADNEAQEYWATDTTNFRPYFVHKEVKSGYRFRYFSNSSDNLTNDATKYVYFAFPESSSSGMLEGHCNPYLLVAEVTVSRARTSKLYYIDEIGTLWTLDVASRSLSNFLDMSVDDVNFDASPERSRIPVSRFLDEVSGGTYY